ncbi:MAG: RsmB/NOP family class I SAM-dependent RNA methyltransferase [Bacteroidia bacterium]
MYIHLMLIPDYLVQHSLKWFSVYQGINFPATDGFLKLREHPFPQNAAVCQAANPAYLCGMQSYPFPKAFIARLQAHFPDQAETILDAMQEPPVLSIRQNPLKGSACFESEEPVPWNPHGRYLQDRPPYVLDPLHHAGAYYVQEASSMLFANAIDFKPGMLMLDLCAAPGGKSTLLLSQLQPESLLISNELVHERAQVLKENLVRWGYPQVMVTNNRTDAFTAFNGIFDVVVVDAPCSGEGMFRKDSKAAELWSEGLVKRCAHDQREMLQHAVDLVKPGGMLIFSTCTFEAEENEANVQSLYEVFGNILQPALLPLQPDWGVKERLVETAQGGHPVYYCLPGLVRGEGMFISCFRKTGEGMMSRPRPKGRSLMALSSAEMETIQEYYSESEALSVVKEEDEAYALPAAFLPLVSQMWQKLKVLKPGLHLGSFKHGKFVPSHELAMSLSLSEKIPVVALDKEQSLKYLSRESFPLPDLGFKGWGIVRYEHLPLGWIKNLGNRFNIHFPAQYKIRLDVERYQEHLDDKRKG